LARATTSIPPGTRSAVEQEREAILEFLHKERQHIQLLKSLLNTVDSNDQELIHQYEDSPVPNQRKEKFIRYHPCNRIHWMNGSKNNLQKDIRPSKSPQASPFFFVEKKEAKKL
jgi:hypothetical protein